MSELSADERQTHLAEIGKFICVVSVLDLMVSAVLGAIMKMGDNGAQELVLHSIPLGQKGEILKSLLLVQPSSERLKHICKLIERAEKLYTKRNIAAHGFITQIDDEQVLVSMTLPKLFKQHKGTKPTALKLSDLPKLSADGIAITDELSNLVEAIETSPMPVETASIHKEVLGLPPS